MDVAQQLLLTAQDGPLCSAMPHHHQQQQHWGLRALSFMRNCNCLYNIIQSSGLLCLQITIYSPSNPDYTQTSEYFMACNQLSAEHTPPSCLVADYAHASKPNTISTCAEIIKPYDCIHRSRHSALATLSRNACSKQRNTSCVVSMALQTS